MLKTLKYILKHPLNEKSKIKAFVNYFKWQIGSRLVPGRVVYDWIDGSMLIIGAGQSGLTANVYCGLHEFIEMSFVLHVLGDNSVFVDIGANAGSYTVLACGVAGAKGYAFEPIPDSFARLMQNVRINNLFENVRCFNIGLGDREDLLMFTSDQDTTNHIISSGENTVNAVKVKVFPLDAVIPAEETVSVIKIDAEGYEYPILTGSRRILENQCLHSLIVEVNANSDRYGVTEKSLLEFLGNYGFRPFSYDPFGRRIISLSESPRLSDNVIFIRNTDLVMNKIRAARRYLINDVEI